MAKTIGDYWRSCNNSQLAMNMVDFLVSLLTNVGVNEEEINIEHEYTTMLDFFNTEYEELPEEKSTNGYSYIH